MFSQKSIKLSQKFDELHNVYTDTKSPVAWLLMEITRIRLNREAVKGLIREVE